MKKPKMPKPRHGWEINPKTRVAPNKKQEESNRKVAKEVSEFLQEVDGDIEYRNSSDAFGDEADDYWDATT